MLLGTYFAILLIAVALVVIALWWTRRGERPTPPQLRRGRVLPDFHAADEHGNAVRSSDLHGSPAVILFVRGNWCPFCTSQVDDLTRHYRDIVDLGARLVFITPKPLETTRRVAAFFKVEFDFWLDEDLAIAQQLGLMLEHGVPPSYDKEYGNDTVWPAALVTDARSVIRFVELSSHISDRPDPQKLLRAIRKSSVAFSNVA